jgi:hypothetical protein
LHIGLHLQGLSDYPTFKKLEISRQFPKNPQI